MKDLSREEKNRLIAEALGFLKPTSEETTDAIANHRYELRRWTLHRRNNAPIENFSSYYWTSPDFYSSEEANALVLEAMPWVKVLRDKDLWTCESDWRFFHNDVSDPARKTAVCEAFLAWRQAQ